ncbi:MAG: protein-(glutamine-N5) methyltransferase, release factor-specific [Candidatus Melainabacteria bacterium GWF2_32_7]|nr:MAG: protein-(glutamine-N5) methyltransferase, release factor-specific [Candidatus Melainabacteria bacterium GWF2_32_7]
MPDNSIKNTRQDAAFELQKSGVSDTEAYIEADILMEYVFGLKKKDVISRPNLILSGSKIKNFNLLVQKRVQEKIPIQYLTNIAYFMGYEFYVNENVLIPRPETEILVERVLDLIKKQNKELKIIDIGTGSGCIACMLAKLSDQKILATDISKQALGVAKINAKILEVTDKVEFIQSDILESIEEKFDIIVSNPPYIPIQDRESLQFEVSEHEPHLALFVDDEKGISFYQKLIEQAKSRLNFNGYLAVEIGISQSTYIKELLESAGYADINIIKDYSNIDRVIIARISCPEF